jgi:hypothetical protein
MPPESPDYTNIRWMSDKTIPGPTPVCDLVDFRGRLALPGGSKYKRLSQCKVTPPQTLSSEAREIDLEYFESYLG